MTTSESASTPWVRGARFGWSKPADYSVRLFVVVMDAVTADPERVWSVSELARESGVKRSTVRLVCADLAASGQARVSHKQGEPSRLLPTKLYRVRPECVTAWVSVWRDRFYRADALTDAVMGARLADGLARSTDAIGYSVYSLEQVVGRLLAGGRRSWTARDLGDTAGLNCSTVRLVCRDLVAVGHLTVRIEEDATRSIPRKFFRLTDAGRAAWRERFENNG
ncbi:hypothetical protein GCM10022243_11500 [Saccharothrix violaceirubra]|uniref:Class 3 adenylate cyclase n=1 Tax=Saccharothrix violaceirubra TaxID=413306 RepID=A0A7W7T8V6_9PSEU|nr:helix-turn-helix domain-containing protein [Saccharothrix violaceirubra]MBB4968650.1 class 3 adenylate cyclase [Saccharothrix violaceirubra]